MVQLEQNELANQNDDEEDSEEEEEDEESEEEGSEYESGSGEEESETEDGEEEEETDDDDEEEGDDDDDDEEEEFTEGYDGQQEYYDENGQAYYDENGEYYDEEGQGEYYGEDDQEQFYDEGGNYEADSDVNSDVAYGEEEQPRQEQFQDEPVPRIAFHSGSSMDNSKSNISFRLDQKSQSSFKQSSHNGSRNNVSFRLDQQSQSSFRSAKSGGSQRSFRPGVPGSGGSSKKKFIQDDHIPDEGITKREMMMYFGCCCCVFILAFGAVAGAFAIRDPPGERLSNFTYSPAPTPNPSAATPSPTDATASPTTPPPPVTVSLTVDADTHVQDGAFAGVVFGRDDSLLARNGDDFNSRILLSFDLASDQFPSDNLFDRTKRATLQLQRVVSIADNSATNITVVKLPPTPSPIERVSWNLYRPVDGVDGPVLTVSQSDVSIVEVDITDFFFQTAVERRSLGRREREVSNLRRTQADATTQLLLMLEASTTGPGIEFRSKDYLDGSAAPKIVVSFSSSTPATPAPVEATPNPTPAPSTKLPEATPNPTPIPTPAPSTKLPTQIPTISPTKKGTSMPSQGTVTEPPTSLNGTSDGGGGTLNNATEPPTTLNGTNNDDGGGSPSNGTEPSPGNATSGGDDEGSPSNGTGTDGFVPPPGSGRDSLILNP